MAQPSESFLKLYRLTECGEYYELHPHLVEGYRASIKAQLDSWVGGKPVHNHYLAEASGDETHGECCPDFSCCGGKMWSDDLRQAFAAADENLRAQMCMLSLSELTASVLPDGVHIAGQLPVQETVH